MDQTCIATILPAREGFSPESFGAVSLTVRDFSMHSSFKEQLRTYGQSTKPAFPELHYEALINERRLWEPNTRGYVRSICKKLNELKPALVEVHNRPVIALRLTQQTPFPIALFLHNDPQEMAHAKSVAAREKLMRECDAIYCISDFIRQRFLEGCRGDASKVYVIHAGLTLPEPPVAKLPHILYVGRMTSNKGVLEFAKALEMLLPRYHDWKGVMAGGRRHAQSERLSGYEKKIARTMNRIGQQAVHHGFLPHSKTMQCFDKASIVVVPSLWDEPYGRTALEAMAHGCAVVSSGRGGLREIIADCGVIVEDVTPQKLANAIGALIDAPEQLQKLQERSIERAKHFSIQHCTQHLDQIRAGIINRAKELSHAA